jgi:hypothetical protein
MPGRKLFSSQYAYVRYNPNAQESENRHETPDRAGDRVAKKHHWRVAVAREKSDANPITTR